MGSSPIRSGLADEELGNSCLMLRGNVFTRSTFVRKGKLLKASMNGKEHHYSESNIQ
jgi:hypothetical protein